MAELLPSKADLKALGLSAMGGATAQIVESMLNDKVDFLADKTWVTDIVTILGGIAISKTKGFKAFGMGFAVVGMGNLIELGLSKVLSK